MSRRQRIPLYLHVGFHKTGTTFIQSVLAHNRAYLAEHGVLFPRVGYGMGTKIVKQRGLVTAGHTAFVKAAKDEAIADVLMKRLRREVRSKRINKIVISAENFDNPLRRSRPAMVKKLFRQYDVHIVIYLRRVDDWLESHYKEVMTSPRHRFSDTLEAILETRYAPALDYFGRVQRWANRFGLDRMHIRIYDEAQKVEGGIIGDFLGGIGSPGLAQGMDTAVGRVNASYGRDIVEACRLFKAANRDAVDFPEKMRSFIDALEEVEFDEDGMRILSPLQRLGLSSSWAENGKRFVEAGLLTVDQVRLLMREDVLGEEWRAQSELPGELLAVMNEYADVEIRKRPDVS